MFKKFWNIDNIIWLFKQKYTKLRNPREYYFKVEDSISQIDISNKQLLREGLTFDVRTRSTITAEMIDKLEMHEKEFSESCEGMEIWFIGHYQRENAMNIRPIRLLKEKDCKFTLNSSQKPSKSIKNRCPEQSHEKTCFFVF